MASQKEIRTRIQSVQKTQKITSAMKVVSAAKLARAQHSVQAARPYADKLADVLESSANVAPADAWQKQILSVIAWAPGHADAIAAAWADVDAAVRADTIVVVTVTDGDDAPLY